MASSNNERFHLPRMPWESLSTASGAPPILIVSSGCILATTARSLTLPLPLRQHRRTRDRRPCARLPFIRLRLDRDRVLPIERRDQSRPFDQSIDRLLGRVAPL